MNHFNHQTVLVTGGAGGLGRRIGELLLQQGASRLILWDVDAAGLAEVAGKLRAAGYTVDTEVIDVADTAKVLELTARTPPVDVLINNAAVVVGKDFIDHSHDEIDQTLKVNTLSLMHVTRALLPAMMKKGTGQIVNIASAAGMMGIPQMSIYSSSKWAVLGWSDSLRLELERTASGIAVTAVTPYYINTGMFDGVRSPWIPILHPDRTARKIVDGIRKKRLYVRLPLLISFLPFVKGILPVRWFDVIVGRVLGAYDTMRSFEGRKK